VSVLFPLYSSIYPPVRSLGLVSPCPTFCAQSYEYEQLFEIKPKLEPWYGEEQGMRTCAIADNIGILSVSTSRGGET
jgi:hypothetical protein